jgi:hypothetical protein
MAVVMVKIVLTAAVLPMRELAVGLASELADELEI